MNPSQPSDTAPVETERTGFKGFLRKVFQSQTSRQTGSYLAALMANAALSFLLTMLLARSLETSAYGSYELVMRVILMSSILLDFGLGSSASRLAAIMAGTKEEKGIIGGSVTWGLLFGILHAALIFMVGVGGAAFGWIDAEKVGVLMIAAPLLILYSFQTLLTGIGRGLNRMGFLAAVLIMPRLFALAAVLGFIAFGSLSFTGAVLLVLGAMNLGHLIGLVLVKPSFSDLRRRMREVRIEIKEFGIQLYYGKTVDAVMGGFDRILVERFYGSAPVGFLSIASTMSSPITMFSQSMGVSVYQRLTRMTEIPVVWQAVNGLICVTLAVLTIVLCQIFIPLFFTERYAAALDVLPYMAVGGAFGGVASFYQTYLVARRQGRPVKVMSITTSGLSIAANIALVPILSITGAGMAYLATYVVHFVMAIWYYRHYVNTSGD